MGNLQGIAGMQAVITYQGCLGEQRKSMNRGIFKLFP